MIPAEWYCELTWPVRPLPTTKTPVGGSWLVVGDASLGAEIGRVLGTDSHVRVLAPAALAADRDPKVLGDALDGVSHVVYAPEVSSSCFDAQPGYELFNAARGLTAGLVSKASPASRLLVLTRNAQPIGEADRANPAHAVLWGLGRTLALEHPEIWGRIIDVDESVPAELAARYVLDEADSGGGEDQVVYRAGVRHVPRLQRGIPPSASATELENDRAHLVIGATGNIGPQLIQQLADMGAGTIVAVSRNPGSRLDELARALSAGATTLLTVAADASDVTAMTALFERFGTDLPPLGGIYLAANGGGAVMLRDMTDHDVTAMFGPKLDAVSVLHHLSLKQPVRQFVMFSSISGVLGAWWLSHYAATTTFLDTFAYARCAAGLPATAIDWGLWKSVADTQTDQRLMLELGLEPMPSEVAIQALWAVTGPHAPVRSTIVAADWTRLATAYRTRAPVHIVDDLLPTDHDDSTDTMGKPAAGDANGREACLNTALRRADRQERQRLLESYLRNQTAGKLGLTPSRLDTQLPLTRLGLDSLTALELRTQIGRDLGIVLPVPRLLDGPSVADLADWLGEQFSGAGPAQPDPTAAADTRATQPNSAAEETDVAGSPWMDLLAEVPQVSDDDVDELLRQVLAAKEGRDER